VLNLSLVIAYGIFRAVEMTLANFRFPMSFQTWLRWGQLFLVLALLAPVTMRWAPKPTRSQMSNTIWAPLSEAGDVIHSHFPKANEAKTEKAVAKEVAITPSKLRFSWDYLSYILLFGLLIALSIKVRDAFRVLKLLNNGIVLRRIGKVTLLSSHNIQVPLSTLVGGRAWVVIPESMVSHWRDFTRAVKHELQHHRQKDTAWAVGIDLLVAVFYLNPFISLWKRKICELQELSCDEVLMGRKVSSYDYGSCLIRVAEAALENGNLTVGTTGMATGFENPNYFKSFLRRRIEMLVNHPDRKPCRFLGVVLGTLMMLSTFAFAYGAWKSTPWSIPKNPFFKV
jgi:beta-lactamase regulating signal transducer with metallopeptidase domain